MFILCMRVPGFGWLFVVILHARVAFYQPRRSDSQYWVNNDLFHVAGLLLFGII